ncbi:MAG: ABC transporter ATP-binding protein [Mariprofundus sp.]|nr:ABC transporter ATP-binding protein [Mariprofundus sp.]
MSSLINISDLSLCRGHKTLLSHLNVDVDAGQITVVLGPNGAGKSTLLLALAGLMSIEKGKISIQGQQLTQFSRLEMSRQIAWQGELPPTEFGLRVEQRLQLAVPDSDDNIQVIAASLQLTTLLQRSLGDLSAGERQRVELAALMLRDTPVWLLDEPTAHLDLKHQRLCLQMLKSQATQGRSIVTVLHDIQQAEAVADQVILIDGKGGVESGEAAQMLTQTKLSDLFDTPLLRQGSILAPDYGGDDESTR